MTLWTVFCGIYGGAILVSLWGGFSVRSFLARHSSISDRRALDAFKVLARWNMYLALLQIGVMGTGFVLGVLLILRFGALRGLGAILVANGIVLGLGMVFKPYEVRARSLPAATPELAAEYAHVSETWVHRPLPDF